MRKLFVLAIAVAVVGGLFAATAIARTRTVEVDDNYFVKRTGSHSVSVRRGDTVRWEWEGSNPHNVTVRSGPTRFRSRTISSGSYRKKVTRAGTYRIVCTIHSGMRMTLRVR
jgi:plastocyanin